MKRKILIIALNLCLSLTYGQGSWPHGRLKICSNNHYLCYEDGTPFFWLGDTGWELFHRLTLEEINFYLENRKAKGFNVIQAVILAELDGLRKPNQYGEVPLNNFDPTTPNEKYFQLVDTVVKMALSKELFLGLLPTWGDKVTQLWGTGPVIFNPTNAYAYGYWIGNRYNDYPNILWILGGDRPPMTDSGDWRPVWRAMAQGILDGTNNKALITYHPWGGEKSSSQYLHNETWLHVNMIQSGHGGGRDMPVWNLIQRDFNLNPTKPTLDAEPNYEDHPVNPWPKWNPENGYFRDYDVRKQIYRSVFSGACGVTYGHHSIWQFYNPREEKITHADRYWTEALDRPGAFQAGYLRKLIESRPFVDRIPDQSIIIKGQGEKGEYITAFRDAQGRYAMIYLPVGKEIEINTEYIKSGKIKASWYNPRNAEWTQIGIFSNKKKHRFTPPTLGFGNDWVLVIDNPHAFPNHK